MISWEQIFQGGSKWFSRGVASLPEGKSLGLCLAELVQASKRYVEPFPLVAMSDVQNFFLEALAVIFVKV